MSVSLLLGNGYALYCAFCFVFDNAMLEQKANTCSLIFNVAGVVSLSYIFCTIISFFGGLGGDGWSISQKNTILKNVCLSGNIT